jgi:hypothetical protein
MFTLKPTAHTTLVVIALKEGEVELVGGRRRRGELQWKVSYEV